MTTYYYQIDSDNSLGENYNDKFITAKSVTKAVKKLYAEYGDKLTKVYILNDEDYPVELVWVKR